MLIRSPLFALVLLALSAAAYGQISISVSFAPPELPVYEQPLCPGDGYLWTPGYWAYAGDDYGYYWVPGTWVMAPQPGLLWTPAYWGWGGHGFVFYNGYWGPQVGFYGGVSYGYGYYGNGYEGGRWQGGQFYYNRSVNNVNVTNIHNVYNTTIINNTTINRVSYNGGNGGISARPTPQQETVAHERHIPPVAAQTQHEQAARTNPEQRAALNHGTPAVAATPKPGAFRDHAVVHAKPTGTPYNPPVNRAAVQPSANAPARILRTTQPAPIGLRRRSAGVEPCAVSTTEPAGTKQAGTESSAHGPAGSTARAESSTGSAAEQSAGAQPSAHGPARSTAGAESCAGSTAEQSAGTQPE